MATNLPAYRLTLYKPRIEDVTESTVLTPAAGAPHSDNFIVASVMGVAGAQPYLELPTGRVGSFDPVARKLAVGNITIAVFDPRTTAGGANASRWVTAFVGDTKGRTRLKGCRAVLERSLNGGASFTPYFAGRVRNVALSGAQRLTLDLKDTADTLQRLCFTGVPHASIGNAAMAAMMPIGVPINFGNILATPRLTGSLSAIFDSAGARFAKLTFDVAQKNWWTALITKAFNDFQGSVASRRVVATIPGVGTVNLEWPSRFIWGQKSISGGSAIQHFRPDYIYVNTLQGDPLTNIPSGTTSGVTFYITQDQPPTQNQPLLINDVHPVQLMADIIDGKYSLASGGMTLSPLGTRDTAGGGPWATLLADPSFGTCRFIIEKSWKTSDFLEQQLCVPYGLGYSIDAQGRVQPFDLRRGAFTPVVALDDSDLIAEQEVAWTDSRDGAITAVEYHSYVDTPRSALDLANLQDQYPDLPPTMLLTTNNILFRLNDLSTLADVGEKIVSIDALGTRIGGGPTAELDANTGAARQSGIGQDIIAAINDYLTPFQSGTLKFKGSYRLAGNAASLRVGQFATVDHTKLPNPATNQRGGARKALVLARTEQGGRIELEFLDFGPQLAASAPTFGTIAVDATDINSIDVPITAGLSTDIVEIWSCVTTQGVGSRPADNVDAWTLAKKTTGSGTLICGPFPRGTRIWFRARSHLAATPANPTAWAYPSPGFLDLGAPSAGSGLTYTNLFANRLDLSWALGDPTLDVELFRTPGTVPGIWTEAMKIAVLAPSTTTQRVGNLAALTQYSFGVRVRDAAGGPSTMATLTVTTTNSTGTAPRPATVDIAVRPSF